MSPKTFLELLTQCDAVIVDGSPLLTSWETSELTGEPDNQIAHFSWIDHDGWHELSSILTEEGITQGSWRNEDYHCEDHEGLSTCLEFYKVQRLISGA